MEQNEYKTEKTDSIEINRNAKGQYTYKLKIYFNSDETPDMEAIQRTLTMDKEIKARYNIE